MDKKRVAQNTLFLYSRLFLLMLITLYTSRVVLKALGVVDYGIYNAVGGLVGLFSMMSGSMTTTINRFFSFEIGKGKNGQLKQTFTTSLFIQFILSLLVLFFLETLGVWFLYKKMVIPVERIGVAFWVLQCAIVTIVTSVFFMPFRASIVAHERMSVFAYFSILEAVIKLAAVYLLTISPIDMLMFYAISQVLVSILILLSYYSYSCRNFYECSLSLRFDRLILYKMVGFTGWNYVGFASYIFMSHGNNLLLNIFFGPALNAARGISAQVGSAVSSLSENVMTAFKPQIIKSYAAGEMESLLELISLGTRVAFFVTLIIAVPLIINADYVLAIWLYKVPDCAVGLTRLSIVYAIICSLSIPLYSATMATGNIKGYQLLIGGLYLMSFILCYICFSIFHNPYMLLFVLIGIETVSCICRLLILRGLIQLRIIDYARKVASRIAIVSLLSSLLFLIPFHSFSTQFLQLSISTVVCVTLTCIAILYFGCTSYERNALMAIAKAKFTALC